MPNAAGPTFKRNAPSRQVASAVAGSLLIHAMVLVLIGLNIARLTPPPLAPVHETDVWLLPLPAVEAVKVHRPPPRAREPSPEPRAALPARSSAPRAPAPRPASAPFSAPSTFAGAAASQGSSPERPSAAEGPDGVAEALRTSVGCDAEHVVRLTPGERDKCAQKYGETARRATPFVKPVDKSFAAQAAEDERRRQNRQGPLQDNVKACTGEGSNLGGACLPDSAIMHVPLPQP